MRITITELKDQKFEAENKTTGEILHGELAVLLRYIANGFVHGSFKNEAWTVKKL